MQSHGLLLNRRTEMQACDTSPERINELINHRQISYYPQQTRSLDRDCLMEYQGQTNHYTSNMFLQELNHVEQQRRRRRRQKLQRELREKMVNSVLRNGVNSQRPYYATLPKRNRTINFVDQIRPQDIRRISRYPKSLQDLTALELEAILDRDPQPSSSIHEDCTLEEYFRRHLNNQGDVVNHCYTDDDYLSRLYRNLPRHSQLPKDWLVPGKVHYEKECRMYGNTVAEIYYKTCYL